MTTLRSSVFMSYFAVSYSVIYGMDELLRQHSQWWEGSGASVYP